MITTVIRTDGKIDRQKVYDIDTQMEEKGINSRFSKNWVC